MRETTDSFSLPMDLDESDLIQEDEFYLNSIKSDVFVHRIERLKDSNGNVMSIRYYSKDEELIEEVFYEEDKITGECFYQEGFLREKSLYKNGVLVANIVYKQNEDLYYTNEYLYNKKNKLIEIRRKYFDDRTFAIAYKYDEIDRVVERLIYKDNVKVLDQRYYYDILDRLIEYKDDDIFLEVKSLSPSNKLLSYVFSDEFGRIISVSNYVSDYGYICSSITLNGLNFSQKDVNYLDSPIFKNPEVTVQDFEYAITFIIQRKKLNFLATEYVQRMKALKNSEQKILPISLRKINLYRSA